MRSLSEKRSETRKISHNPEVSGSNPLPATKQETLERVSFFIVILILCEYDVHSPLPEVIGRVSGANPSIEI